MTFTVLDRTACSEQNEGILFAPRDDTGIIAFVLVKKQYHCEELLYYSAIGSLNSPKTSLKTLVISPKVT